MRDLWYPTIYIGNALKFKSQGSFGPEPKSLNILWYDYHRHLVRYSEVFSTTVSCQLSFNTFPFDSHECTINLKNWDGATYRLVLKSPNIYTVDGEGKEIGGSEFNFTNHGRLDYDFYL